MIIMILLLIITSIFIYYLMTKNDTQTNFIVLHIRGGYASCVSNMTLKDYCFYVTFTHILTRKQPFD